MTPKNALKVFYDGSCRVCDSEIGVYRKISREADIAYIDISSASFDAQRYGKSREEFMRVLHVMDQAGSYYTGVEAFRLLWRYLPGTRYRLLAFVTGLPGIKQLAKFGYRLFARNRHLLPRHPQG